MSRLIPMLTAPKTPSGMVQLVPETGRGLVSLELMLMGDPDRSGGVGGWETSERIGGRDASWWKSTPAGTWSAPCAFDIEVGRAVHDIEWRLARLYELGVPGEGHEAPPAFRMYGDCPTARRSWWKLDGLDLGRQLFRAENTQKLLRIYFTLAVSEHDPLQPVGAVSIKATRQADGKRRRREIRSVERETLRSIAVTRLGSSGAYKQLREWNPKLKDVDPDLPLRVNTLIVLH